MTQLIPLFVSLWLLGVLLCTIACAKFNLDEKASVGETATKLLLWPLFLLSVVAYGIVRAAKAIALAIWLAIKWPWIRKESE